MSEAMLAAADHNYREPSDEVFDNIDLWGNSLDYKTVSWEDIGIMTALSRCPIYGDINIPQTMKDRREAMENEYELFSKMHVCDGTFSKRQRSL